MSFKTGDNQHHADRAHAVLSASGSERWMNCTASARMEEPYPDQGSSYAAEGTLAHEIAETELLLITKRLSKKDYSKRMKGFIQSPHYYQGIMEDVLPYVQYVQELIATDPQATILIEQRLDFSDFVPDGFGTGDFLILANGILHVCDLKFGKGVRVSAHDNPQLKLYGVGAMRVFELTHAVEAIRLTIIQPPLDSISTFDITPGELFEWANLKAKPAATLAFKGEGKQVPGEWCKFCKAKVSCAALKKEALSLAQADFNSSDKNPNEILEVYRIADRVSDYLGAVKAHVLQLAIEGTKWSGYKLVEGRSNRRIADEAKAREALISQGYASEEINNVKLKGIGDLEKLLGKKGFPEILGAYTDKHKGAPTLVEESDPRPIYSNADDFKENN